MITLIEEPRRTAAVRSRGPALALAWSAAATALGVYWLVDDTTYPFAPDVPAASMSLIGGLPARVGIALLTVLAASGVAVHLLGRLAPSRSRLPLVAATTLAVIFGLFVPDVQLLIVAGYLVALSVPVAAVVAVLACLRSPRRAVIAALALAAFGTWAWQTGSVTPDALGGLGAGLGDGFSQLGIRPLVVLFLHLGGVAWAVAAAGAYGGTARLLAASWTRPEAVRRWGPVATLVAAACTLPYALLRMTWLTPWPVGFDASDFASRPGIRIFGLLLGLAAVGGGVLTLGLISRWGEVWPGWIPVLRGRPVPVAAAVIPGTAIAALLTLSGVSQLRAIFEQGQWVSLVIFPFLIWGPALAAATLAYHLRRRPVRR